jgi:hypothetical protein
VIHKVVADLNPSGGFFVRRSRCFLSARSWGKSDADHAVLPPSYLAFFAVVCMRGRREVELTSDWRDDISQEFCPVS